MQHFSLTTHIIGPGGGGVGEGFLFVQAIDGVQPLLIALDLAVLVGKAPHRLHVGEGLGGDLVGLGNALTDLFRDRLKGKEE